MLGIRNSKGDTIVEVLIALAVLTSVMVGAFVTANRAQNASQASQERGEAIKIAETQIERVKGLLAATPPFTPPGGVFCIKDDNTVETITTPANPFAESLEVATLPYLGACGNTQGRYNIAVVKDSGDTYSFLVRWYRVGGGRDQINMYYRVY